jgi:hypothetical protein
VPQTSIGLAAFRYLESADFATRLKWTARATEAGVALPPAATARENLHLWVDQIAEAIVSEERLIVRDKTADR